MRGPSFLIGSIIFLVLAEPAPALANSGVPTIMLIWPLAWVLLVPIVLLEAEIMRRLLSTTFRRSFKVTLLANLASTLIGIPLAQVPYFLFAAIVDVLMQALPSSNPYVGVVRLFISLPIYAGGSRYSSSLEPVVAVALAQIPAFFMSVFVEYRVAKRSFAVEEHPRVKAWSWRANEASYGFVVALLLVLALLGH